MFHKQPHKDTSNPPGQVVGPEPETVPRAEMEKRLRQQGEAWAADAGRYKKRIRDLEAEVESLKSAIRTLSE